MLGMDWQRLADEVVTRRLELGYRTREAFAGAAGISPRVIGDIERNRRDNYDRVTISRLEMALRWPQGRIRAILRGEDSSPPRVGVQVDPLLVVLNSTLDGEEKTQLCAYVLRRRMERDAELVTEVKAIIGGNECDQ
jgi:hypothetical protein